ncbi:allantoicase-like [Battus philenor]|uniref:allantoicase-like n=1 Tax=Battus philenor TaxID=42288 RepID=UPI0035D01B2F
MIEHIKPNFIEFSELASAGAGGKVVFSTDDFFATCENMISDTEPIFIEDKYTEFGKWMDGWETRRKRVTGHDWCIIKLATKCVIKGFLVDTAFFTGNYAPKYSIQAACLSKEDEEAIPQRVETIGTACTESDLEQIKSLKSDVWEEIVPTTALLPGYEQTRRNYQKVLSDDAWTHIRVNIYPDGGIARLRVFGEPKPEPPAQDEIVDLVSVVNGGCCIGYSNAHFGHPKNIIKPGKSKIMSDGWETARRLDRPDVIEANDDGTLKLQGNEWAVFKLGFTGTIKKICVDTTQFKGNYPDSITIEGVHLDNSSWTESKDIPWRTILKPSRLGANKEHWYNCDSDVTSHVRVTMAPDGGISRIKLFGWTEN